MAETTANDIQNELTTGTTRTGIITRTGGAISELRRMANQPAVKRAMPAVAAIAVVFVGLIAYMIFSSLVEQLYTHPFQNQKNQRSWML